jgi:calcium-dependent protein kinase
MRKILNATAYMHSKNIIHRDLKLENIVFLKKIDLKTKEEEIDLKIIDFGAAKILTYKKIKDNCEIGTYTHMAPEVIEGVYSTKCDVWSCGIILHILLSGISPFRGLTKDETFNKIKNAQISFLSIT